MPGWPTADRDDDFRLVAAVRRGDGQSLAALYDSYAEAVYDYCSLLLGHPDPAADAVLDVFAVARSHAGRLRDPRQLRVWLYAIARAVGRALAAPASSPSPPERDKDPRQEEMRALVTGALSGLGSHEREILELTARHNLDLPDAARLLGVSGRSAAALLSRARSQLEQATAPVVMARTAKSHCPDLAAMVDAEGEALTPLLRRRLGRHLESCSVCDEGRRRRVTATALLGYVPRAAVPLSLRGRLLESERPDPVMEFGRDGFPIPRSRTASGSPRFSRLPALAAAAACVLVAAGATAIAFAVGRAERPLNELVQAAVPQATTTPLPTTRSTALPLPLRSPTPGPKKAPRPSPSKPAPPGRLEVTSCPGDIGSSRSGTMRLKASVNQVRWTASASSDRIGFTPSGGSLSAGESRTVQVNVSNNGWATGAATITVSSNGGSGTCPISWSAR